MYRAWYNAYKDGPQKPSDVPPQGWFAIIVAALIVLLTLLGQC